MVNNCPPTTYLRRTSGYAFVPTLPLPPLKLIIFLAASTGLVHWILLPSNLQFIQHDLLRIKAHGPCQMQIIGKDIGKFLLGALRFGLGSPLETLRELGGFDGDALS